MKQIAKIEFIHLNKADYVIAMLKQVRDKAAEAYPPEDIYLLLKQKERNTTTAIFYLLEMTKEK